MKWRLSLWREGTTLLGGICLFPAQTQGQACSQRDIRGEITANSLWLLTEYLCIPNCAMETILWENMLFFPIIIESFITAAQWAKELVVWHEDTEVGRGRTMWGLQGQVLFCLQWEVMEAFHFGEREDQICLLKKLLCLFGQMKHLLLILDH